MKQSKIRVFLKYFAIGMVIQLLFAGFVFLTVQVFGSAIGDGILFLFYALPWMIVLSGQPKDQQEISTFFLITGSLIPATVYATIFSVGACLIAGVRMKLNVRS